MRQPCLVYDLYLIFIHQIFIGYRFCAKPCPGYQDDTDGWDSPHPWENLGPEEPWHAAPGGECRDSWREAGKRCKSRQTRHNCSGGEAIYLFWGYGAEERRLGGLKLLFSLLGVWDTTIKNLPMSSNPHGWKANQDSGLHGKSFCHHPPPPCQSGHFCLSPHDDVLPKLMSYPFPPRVHLGNSPNKRHSPLKAESYSVLLGVLGTWAQVLLRLNWLTAQSHLRLTANLSSALNTAPWHLEAHLPWNESVNLFYLQKSKLKRLAAAFDNHIQES